MAPFPHPVLLAVPAFGVDHLTDAVLRDLVRDPVDEVPGLRIVVVDNRGDHTPAVDDPRVELHRPSSNLKWLGTVNWALAEAERAGDAVCVVLNNDTRLSRGFVAALVATFTECEGVAVAAPTYDDFWLHARAREIPATADAYRSVHAYRPVPFCDGTGFALSVEAVRRVGGLDAVAFPEQGYGADIDLALRARDLGYRCVVTEAAYLSHHRRGTMAGLPDESAERHRAEILTGLAATRGDGWRAQAGLGPGAFPPHNTGSSASWYA